MSKRRHHSDRGKLARRVGRLEARHHRDLNRLKRELLSAMGHMVDLALFRGASAVSIACVGCGARWLAGDFDDFQTAHAGHG